MNFGYLAVLACPVSMGLMMWTMMRGGSRPATEDARIAALQGQIDALHRERDSVGRDPERIRLSS